MSRTSKRYCDTDNRDLHPTYHKIHWHFDQIYVSCIDKGKQRIQRKGHFPQLAIEVFLQKKILWRPGALLNSFTWEIGLEESSQVIPCYIWHIISHWYHNITISLINFSSFFLKPGSFLAPVTPIGKLLQNFTLLKPSSLFQRTFIQLAPINCSYGIQYPLI